MEGIALLAEFALGQWTLTGVAPDPLLEIVQNNNYVWEFAASETVSPVSLPVFLLFSKTETGYKLAGKPYAIGTFNVVLKVGLSLFEFSLKVLSSSVIRDVSFPNYDRPILLVQANYWNPTTGNVERHYFASEAYVTSPSDRIPSKGFIECLSKDFSITKELTGGFDSAVVATKLDNLSIDNPANQFDALLFQSFGMRRVFMWVVNKGAAFSQAKLIYTGYTAQAGMTTSGETTLVLPLSDSTERLNKPIQKNVYPSSVKNSLENKVLPDCLGEVFNIEPLCIDTVLQVYQFNSTQSQAVIEVRDGGYPLTKDIDYSVDLTNSTITLTLQPRFQLTMDVKGTVWNGVYLNTAVDFIEYLLATRLPELTIANTANARAILPQSMGVYITEKISFNELFNKLLGSAGGFLISNEKGEFVIKRFMDITGNPVAKISSQIVLGSMSLSKRIAPVASLRIGYRKNFTPQVLQKDDGSSAQAITEEARQKYKQEWKVAAYENQGITERYREATELESESTAVTESYLVKEYDAKAESTRRALMYSRIRDCFEFSARLNGEDLQVGDEIAIAYNRFGLNLFTSVIILKVKLKPVEQITDLTVMR